MSSFVAKTKLDFVPDFVKYANICEDLNESFKKCFHDLSDREKHLSLFERPFTVKVEEIENAELQLELLDLRSNEGLRDVYQEQSLLQFYSQLQEETYPVLLKNARFWIAQFGSTYRCEQGFSVMKLNKSKLRSQLIDDQSINQSIYLFVLCFETKNIPTYVKKSLRKHRKAAK